MKYSNKALRGILGMRISWSENGESAKERAGEIINAKIGHTNAVYRPVATSIWLKLGERVSKKYPLLWKVQVQTVYTTKGGDEITEEQEFIAHTLLDDLALECQPYLDASSELAEEIEKELGEPVTLHEWRYVITCMGNRTKKKSDFKLEA